MKTRFVTIAECAGPFRVTVWEQDDEFTSRPVEWHESLEPLEEAIQVWSFDHATSVDVQSPFNPSNYPVLDADGAPLWAGCEVEFVRRTHYVNTDKGCGEVKSLDGCGGALVAAERPMPVYERGVMVGESDLLDLSMQEYMQSGPLKGAVVLKAMLGDPHEHGQIETYVRRLSDPRTACTWMGPTEGLPGEFPTP